MNYEVAKGKRQTPLGGETLDQEEKPLVQIPEKEATELAKRLRHSLKGVALSVYAYISKKGLRALHVAVDCEVKGVTKSYDIHYKADSDMTKMARNAINRITAEFELNNRT